MDIDIGHAAKEIRSATGLTQRAFGLLLGMAHVYVNNIENNLCSPTVRTMGKYFDATGIHLYMLAVAYSDDESVSNAFKINYRHKLTELMGSK